MTSVNTAGINPSIRPISNTEIRDKGISPIEERDELGDDQDKAESEAKEKAEREAKVEEVPVHDVPEPDPDAEVRRPRVARRPVLPTKADVEEHFPLHLQYRSWCEHCVAGKSRMTQHIVEASDRERLGVTVMMDYAFMTPEEVEEDMQPTLVIFDDDEQAFWAWASSRKASQSRW